MSLFRYSICHPFSPNIQEMGKVNKEEFLKIFNDFPWLKLLQEMEEAETFVSGKEIHYSPSLEVENTVNKNGLSISIVDGKDQPEFYIFYKRPEVRKTFFGLVQKLDEDYLTDREGQTLEDALSAVNALFDNNLTLLKSRWG
jgi:hypothetical protein